MKWGSLCGRKPPVIEINRDCIFSYVVEGIFAPRQIQNHILIKNTDHFTYINLFNIQSNHIQNHKSISEEKTDSLRICDLL